VCHAALKSVRSRRRCVERAKKVNEMQARDQAESMSRMSGRLEHFWLNALDRDGMERVSDWFVCVLLLLCARGPEECARQAFGCRKRIYYTQYKPFINPSTTTATHAWHSITCQGVMRCLSLLLPRLITRLPSTETREYRGELLHHSLHERPDLDTQ
jgi:hypothetical protein